MKGLNEMDMDMDIMEIVDMMEEAIEKASAVPLTGKVMIDKGELLDYIQEIRLVYPDEYTGSYGRDDQQTDPCIQTVTAGAWT